jgi:hypothetical protein
MNVSSVGEPQLRSTDPCRCIWDAPNQCYPPRFLARLRLRGTVKALQYVEAPMVGGDGSRLPTANELQDARYQDRKIAETANKLHG